MEVAVVQAVALLEEIEVLLLGGHSPGITNQRKCVEWQKIPAAVNIP